MKLTVFSSDGTQTCEQEFEGLPVFEGDKGLQAVKEVIVAINANNRLGTHSTKTRGEVRGGGRKPWRQKGTGRARHGSTRSPIWVGGGVVFGPTPRSYSYRLPKKARRAALKSALSAKAAAGNILVLDQLSVEQPKTKVMVNMFKALEAKKPLVVTAEWDSNVELSTRNIPGAVVAKPAGLNVYDILNSQELIITKDAVAKLEEVLA